MALTLNEGALWLSLLPRSCAVVVVAQSTAGPNSFQ